MSIRLYYPTGKNKLRIKTNVTIATKKIITCLGSIINLLLYSSLYLINPPNPPGIYTFPSLAILNPMPYGMGNL
jgi:hypothetical protein